MNRAPVWLRMSVAALAGAAAMIGLGQLFSLAGGTCGILCRPHIAGLYGAALGLLFARTGSAVRSAASDSECISKRTDHTPEEGHLHADQ